MDKTELSFDELMAPPSPHSTVVVNIRREAYDVYIGRPGKWGNPFALQASGDRSGVIARYAEYIQGCPDLLADLEELSGKRLGCYCKPLPCHGDVLRRLLIERFGEKTST